MEYRIAGAKTMTPTGYNWLNENSDRNLTILGWFSNKYNHAAGWVVCELSNFDKEWLTSEGIDISNVYRSYSDTTDTFNVVRIDGDKGTYAFLDSECVLANEPLRFERMVRYRKFILDQ